METIYNQGEVPSSKCIIIHAKYVDDQVVLDENERQVLKFAFNDPEFFNTMAVTNDSFGEVKKILPFHVQVSYTTQEDTKYCNWRFDSGDTYTSFEQMTTGVVWNEVTSRIKWFFNREKQVVGSD